jgi:hypothetical protein
MRMNISVPDELAAQVRELELPISAICQNALRDEVNRIHTIKTADDVLVYVESEQADPDPLTWPGFDPAKPTLIYKRYPVGRHWELGWVLEYELGDEPGDNPTEEFTGGEPADPPIEWARHVVREATRERELGRGMEEITVDVGEPSLTVGFTGRWLIEPSHDETRTAETGYDAGAYWGVALTKRGRIAVYTAHCNERWPARLRDYDGLDQAASDATPADIIARAAAELGETRVIWRDI